MSIVFALKRTVRAVLSTGKAPQTWAALLLALCCGFQAAAQDPATPDFTKIPDILNGQRTMLGIQDLYV